MSNENPKKIPVILDTDIGDDIDDTWAVALMLNSPELDVKLIVTDFGNTPGRAKIVAKYLEVCGRTDIPVGIGIKQSDKIVHQAKWADDYDLDKYPGKIYYDGVGAIIDTIMQSEEPVTLIAIGPMPNIAAALERKPAIAKRARFIGMQGSIYKGYGGSEKVCAEYNVKADPKSCRKAFTAPWDITITPLDTCGLVRLTGEKYRKVYESALPGTRALIENYKVWCQAGDPEQYREASSTLFDTAAVYLAISEDLLNIEKLGVRVTDDGFTVIDETAKKIRCATSWKDLAAFEDFLVNRLT